MNLGIIASSITVGGGASYLLDTYTGAGAAYSLRKLSSAATNAVQIRRTSDSSTTNIGFAGADLNTAAVNSFCTGTTCVVQTWYDQSGSGNHLSESPTPWTIYSGGAVFTINGRAALVNPDDNNGMTTTIDRTDIAGSSQFYSVSIATPLPGGSNTVIDVDGDTTSFGSFGSAWFNASFTVAEYSSAVDITDDDQGVFEVAFESSSSIKLYANGTLVTPELETTGAYAPTGISGLDIGRSMSSIHECIIWPVNQASNRSSIYTNINTYY